MDYSDSFEQANEYLRIALPLINKHHMPPNPMQYTLWYAYASGQNSKLTNAINQILKTKNSINEEQCIELYKNHIKNHDTVSLHIHESVTKVMEALSDQLVESSDQAQHFDDVLGIADKQLDGDNNSEVLHEVVKNLSDETNIMQSVNQHLTQKLVDSSSQLESLKQELEEARKAANTDILTGIPNRQAFEEKIASLIREKNSFCFLIADIDFFKRFNDTYGHQLGDKVLRFVAQTLQKQLKGQDMVSRYGGEEFVVVLPDTPFAGAIAVAENLRKAIQKQKLRRADNQKEIGSITLSIGVSKYRAGEDAKDMIERADKALYAAKENGRNRVEAETSVSEPA